MSAQPATWVPMPSSWPLAQDFMRSRSPILATPSTWHSLGAEVCLDWQATQFETALPPVNAVIDLVGDTTLRRSLRSLKRGGIVVSVVSTQPLPKSPDYRSVFFYADVTTARLDTISSFFAQGKLRVNVGTVLSLERIREAHLMLAGAPHNRGKIVLTLAG